MKRAWTKRELIGEIPLDTLNNGKQIVLKAFRKWWPDGPCCLDLMKYVKFDDTESFYQPAQHIQLSWDFAAPFLRLFNFKCPGCDKTFSEDEFYPAGSRILEKEHLWRCWDCDVNWGFEEIQNAV